MTAARPPRLADFDLARWMRQRLDSVESALGRWVGPAVSLPPSLAAPMRYAVLDGGKRLRPLLVLAACEVLRRGKPTVHVQFGQASAMLAGDALQALAFELLTPDDAEVPPPVQAQLCRMLARAAGGQGMAGGQAIDLAHVGQRIDALQLHEMHRLKTGALLLASVQMGAVCGQPDAQAMAALSEYGRTVGLAFQVVDDILDVTADSQTLGKTAGKDAAQDKPTFVSLMGLRQSQNYAQELLSQAQASLRQSGLSETRALQALADKLVNRAF